MIATTIQELESLRNGTLDVAKPLSFDQVSASALINELSATHGYVFQQRSIGSKTEIGIARTISLQMVFRASQRSMFLGSRLIPILLDCYLISGYDDVLSEVTWSKRISVRPVSRSNREVSLQLGTGYKLDKIDESWSMKPLLRRKMKLSEKVLQDRGWQFDLFKRVLSVKQ